MHGELCCFRTSTIHLNYNLGLTPKLVLKLWSQGKCRSDFIGQCSLFLTRPLVGFWLLSRNCLIFWHHAPFSRFCQDFFFMVQSICWTVSLSSGIKVYPSCFYVIQSICHVTDYYMQSLFPSQHCSASSIIAMMFQFIPVNLVQFCFILHVNLLNSCSCQHLLQ